MKIPHYRFAILSVVIAVIACGCGAITFLSKWKTHDITIDGIDTEWRGSRYLIDKQYVTIGIMNDSDYLYFRVSTPDRAKQMKISRSGMTVWFDPNNDFKKIVGLKYPLKTERLPFRRMEDREGDASPPDRKPENHAVIDMPSFPDSLAIVDGKAESEEVFSIDEARNKGFEAKLAPSDRDLIYEAKVPLEYIRQFRKKKTTGNKETIAIGIDIPRADADMLKNNRRNNPNGDRRSDINMMGPDSRYNPDMEAYELWLTVIIATKP